MKPKHVVKVLYERLSDGTFKSIRKHKIYYDTKTREYKRQFKCNECGVDVGCFCFEELDGIIFSIFDGGISCDRCGLIEYVSNDHWVLEAAHDLLDVPLSKSINRAIRNASDADIARVMDVAYDGVDCDFMGWTCNI